MLHATKHSNAITNKNIIACVTKIAKKINVHRGRRHSIQIVIKAIELLLRNIDLIFFLMKRRQRSTHILFTLKFNFETHLNYKHRHGVPIRTW